MEGEFFQRLQQQVGAQIRARRRLLRLDQASLAELAGVSRHTLSNVESGKGNPTLAVLCEICDAVGMEVRLEVRGTRSLE